MVFLPDDVFKIIVTYIYQINHRRKWSVISRQAAERALLRFIDDNWAGNASPKRAECAHMAYIGDAKSLRFVRHHEFWWAADNWIDDLVLRVPAVRIF